MKVQVFPADRGGCGYYRLIWPARALVQSSDLDIRINMPDAEGNCTINAIMQDKGKYTEVIDVEPLDADVVVLQRPLRSDIVSCIPHIRRQGIAVVVEVDDHFSAIDPQNKAWSAVQGGYRSHYNLMKACQMADLVTVTTPELKRVYGFENPPGWLEILPNYVPKSYLDISRPEPSEGKPVIGWTGSVETHPNDLQQVGGAVSRLVAAQVADFSVVGTGAGVARRLGLPPDYEVKASKWVSLSEYPYYMSQFDIGIAPLDLTPFNEAKSWLKGLEFAALGIPFVASGTEPYCALSELGIGLIAKARKWDGPLRQLLRDSIPQEGERLRKAILDYELTIEDNAWKWELAWRHAHENRKKDP